MPRVLIIEDDEGTVRRFTDLLSQIPDLEIDSAMTAAQARQMISSHQYQLALVDIDLGPGMDGKYAGLSLLHDLKDQGCTSLVVSGTGEDNLQGVSIELDAYDFIGKPINETGFINKVNHALTFHASDANPNRGSKGAWPAGLAEDPVTKTTLIWRNKPVNLSLTELSIVRCLVSQPGHVVEHRKLATAMKSTVSSAALASHFSNIRRKFRVIDDSFDHITADPGKGYYWKP
jgi:DNA-binding response OmpR family regulator